MKKKIFLLIFLLISIFTFSIFKYAKNNKKKLVYGVYSMPQFELDNLKRTLKKFSEENDGITVEIKEVAKGYEGLKEAITDPDNPIDIFIISYPLIPVYAKTSLIKPLTKYHGIEKSAEDSSWEAYGYPRKTIPYGLIFNKNLLKYSKIKLPKTKAEFKDALQKLADAGVKNPFVIDTNLEEYIDDPLLSEFILNALPKTEFDYYNDLLTRGLMVKAKAIGKENRYDAFLKCEAAFIISTAEGMSYIESEDPSLDFGTISFLEEDNNPDQLLRYNRYVIGKNSKNPDLAFKLIEFLNNQI